MASNSKQFPEQFASIPRYTMQKGKWEKDCGSSAKAYTFKSSWYRYVTLLKEEGNLSEWAIASRVKVKVSGSIIHFEDRNASEFGKLLDEAFADLAKDEVDLAAEEMMKEYNKRSKL